MKLAGYNDFILLHEGHKNRVYSALDETSGKRVALKTPMSLLPTGRELAVLGKEFQCLKGLQVEGVSQAFELVDTGKSSVMVMRYYECPTLREVLASGAPSIAEMVALFVRLVRIVEQLHRQGVIHKDITPSNILCNRKTGEVALIDFGSALDVPQQSVDGVQPDVVDGTFAYMSPEQTGRVNRSLDYRTDFYTIGVVLYEALCGRVPFEGDDLGEMVHSHIAVEPEAPVAVNSDIPQVLSDLVLKCLSKDAAGRYHSAKGLAMDLEKCLADLEQSGEVRAFELAAGDVSDRFVFPERLVGREAEMNLLREYYSATAKGQSGVLMVSGHSGVGKTSLVRELNREVAASGGYVTYGKFDQYNRSTPYSGLVQAFSRLIRQILTESGKRLELWRGRILEAVGENAGVLFDVIPEIANLLGEQPQPEELGPAEARTRFSLVFSQFIEVFGQDETPLVVFLDDLQWVDSSSLSLMELFGAVDSGVRILFVGAYRSNEVSSTHPLSTALVQMKDKGARLDKIHLAPLDEKDVAGFMAELLSTPVVDVSEAAHVVFEKTEGNPLFFKTLLVGLYEAGHIVFNHGEGKWQWDLSSMRAAPFADNVVEALQGRIATLPDESVELLKLGALAGSPFSLDFLSRLSGAKRQDVATSLKQALAHGFITADTKDHDLYAQQQAAVLDNISYSFTHDRLQQAAYALLEEERLAALHLEAGRMLMLLPKEQHSLTHLFDTAEHMRHGQQLITEREERILVAQIVLQAGIKAKVSTAFVDAAGLLEFAAELLPDDGWDSEYSLACSIKLEFAEALYLSARYEEAEALHEEIEKHVANDNDRLKLYNIQTKQYHHQARFVEAVAIEYKGLALLGIDIPESDDDLMPLFGAEAGRIAELLEGKTPGDLFGAKENDDPIFMRKQEILFDLFADSYLIGRGLLCGTVSAIMARLCMEEGHNSMASVAYINYASTVCAMGADYPTGYAFGELAVKLAEKYRVPAYQNYTYHVFSLAVNHWQSPLDGSHGYWKEASKLALASGSPYAGYVFLQLAHVLLASNKPLDEVELQAQQSFEFLQKSGMEAIVTLLRLIVLQPLKHLRGETNGLDTLDDGEFSVEAFLAENSELPFFVGSLYYSMLRVATLSGKSFGLEKLSEMIGVVDATQQGQIMLADCHFYFGLQLLDGYTNASEADREEFREPINAVLERMDNWASLCEDNFRHKALLLQAEFKRVSGDTLEAMDLYDASIEQALKQSFLLDAAIAAEKAGVHWEELGKSHFAKSYLEQAYVYYGRLGARAKLTQLREAYSGYFAKANVPVASEPFDLRGESSSLLGTRSFSEGLDLASVLKASQAVSKHIVMDDLGAELLNIAVENAGATKGVLLINKEGTYYLVNMVLGASGSIAINETLQDSEIVSKAVVNYVVRTGTAVVVDDVATNTQFAQCEYLRSHELLSLCCIPILHQRSVRGVLFLENDQSTGVFKPDRLHTLKLLAGQATISMENARVYQQLGDMNRNLEGLVQERTAQLQQKNEELNDKNFELVRLSTTDQLTGISNRRRLEEMLEREVGLCQRYDRSVAVILLDVDNFKKVNDTYGHHAGDDVLVRVASTIRDSIRKTDVVGRWGGEEFMVIVPEFAQNVVPFAEKVRAALEAVQHPQVGTVTASMGVAEFKNGETPSELISRADEALYRAKENGRNRVEKAE